MFSCARAENSEAERKTADRRSNCKMWWLLVLLAVVLKLLLPVVTPEVRDVLQILLRVVSLFIFAQIFVICFFVALFVFTFVWLIFSEDDQSFDDPDANRDQFWIWIHWG